jgi:hypothetical protein
MSVGSSTYPDGSSQVLLRWSDPPDSPSREQFVQMIEAHVSEAVIRSEFEICEDSQVSLIGNSYNERGVVRSCRAEDGDFILTIGIQQVPCMPEGGSFLDPGVFAIEDFITEEQTLRILNELEDQMDIPI